MHDRYPFEPIPLSYGFGDLEPWLDQKTMETHYKKHYGGYINKLNAALKKHPELQNKSLRELLCLAPKLPCDLKTEILHNAGGVYNHSFYFSMLTPNSKAPCGPLADAIQKCFGSFGAMQEEIVRASGEVFGSGYVWLLTNQCGELSVSCSANQETNLPAGKQKLLAIDVWEHAYYLKYLNRREEYAANLFHIIDWQKAELLYAAASSKRLCL